MSSDVLLPAPATDPDTLLEVYGREPHLHPYGIADVVQLWDRSTWWCDGEAAVGVMDLPGSPMPVLYAVSSAPTATLDLVEQLEPGLPPQLMATGPEGLAARLAGSYDAAFITPHVKMHHAHPQRLPTVSADVVALKRPDLRALEALFDTDPLAGDFFHAGLLDTGFYLGIWDGHDVVAAGGIHVIDEEQGVAALGNITTHPLHRRRGLGRSVVTSLCHRLREHVPTIGLNVRLDNAAARGLYEALGFQTILAYEETELMRRPWRRKDAGRP